MGAPVLLNATPARATPDRLPWFEVAIFKRVWDIGFSAKPILYKGRECWGLCDMARAQITLDPLMPPDLRRTTLLHELGHAAADHYRRRRGRTPWGAMGSVRPIDGDAEERAIVSFTVGGLTDVVTAMGWRPPKLPAGFKAFAARRARHA